MNRIAWCVIVFVVAAAVGFASAYAVVTRKNHVEDDTVNVSGFVGSGGSGSSDTSKEAENGKHVDLSHSSGLTGSKEVASSDESEAAGADVDAKAERSEHITVANFKVAMLLEVSDRVSSYISCQVGKKTYTYSLTNLSSRPYFTIEGADTEELKFVLEDMNGHVYESDNGSFRGIEPTKDGLYLLHVLGSNKKKSNSVEVKGFGLRRPIQDRLTADALEQLISSGDYEGVVKAAVKGKISESVTVRSANESFNVSTIAQATTKVGMENWKVSVESVEYDCLDRVLSVLLNAEK